MKVPWSLAVNANYSERSARIPDSIIERANDVTSGMDYWKFDLKFTSTPLRNDREWQDRYYVESEACTRSRERELNRECGIEFGCRVDRSNQGWNETFYSSILGYRVKRPNGMPYRLARLSGAMANCNDPILLASINFVPTTLRRTCEWIRRIVFAMTSIYDDGEDWMG